MNTAYITNDGLNEATYRVQKLSKRHRFFEYLTYLRLNVRFQFYSLKRIVKFPKINFSEILPGKLQTDYKTHKKTK